MMVFPEKTKVEITYASFESYLMCVYDDVEMVKLCNMKDTIIFSDDELKSETNDKSI